MILTLMFIAVVVYEIKTGANIKKIGKRNKQFISFLLSPIRRRSTSNSFHELSMTSVSIGVIGELWGVTKRELVRNA